MDKSGGMVVRGDAVYCVLTRIKRTQQAASLRGRFLVLFRANKHHRHAIHDGKLQVIFRATQERMRFVLFQFAATDGANQYFFEQRR